MTEYGAKAITPPDWFCRNAVYQINPRTFSKEGTLDAVTLRLSELKKLGFDIIYICPAFEEDDSEDRSFWSIRQKSSGTNNPKNPYRINNYFRVDCEYGNDADLRKLVDTAHSLGQRVIFDLVYMHIAPNAPIVKRHPEFIIKDENGVPILTKYNFYTLDFKNAGLCEYLWCNMVYFVSEFDIDGYRCDVGDAVPIEFWSEGRRRIKAIKPECIMINEGKNFDYLTKAFDSIYTFNRHEIIYRIISGESTVAELVEYHKNESENAPDGALPIRDMDNHDTATDWPERVEKRAGHAGMELITVLNYITEGIPMIYSGNELADSSNHSMFANRFFDGGYGVTNRDALLNTGHGQRRADIVKRLNHLKKESDVLRYGKCEIIQKDGALVVTRRYNDKAIMLVANLSKDKIVYSDILPQGKTLLKSEIELNMPYGYIVKETENEF